MANYLVFPDDAEQGVPKHFRDLKKAVAYAYALANKRKLNVRIWRENLRTGLMERVHTANWTTARKVNPSQVHHSIGYPTKAQAEKAKRSLATRGGGPYKLSHKGGWWYVVGPKVSNPARRFPGTFTELPVGSTFTFRGEIDYPYSGFARGPWIKTGARTYTHAETGGKYRVGSTRAKVVAQNPAGVEAIPTKWTKATISTRGGQVQIRTGGRR